MRLNIRNGLDRLYSWLGALAALCILAICAIIVLQVILNLIARIGGVDWAWSIPSYGEIAGYLLAASTFLALADTLVHSVHIRVSILTDRLGPKAHWYTEIFALSISVIMAAIMCFSAVQLWLQSIKFGDKSSGILAIPLALPQFFMVTGLLIFTIALADILWRTIKARRPVLTSAGGE